MTSSVRPMIQKQPSSSRRAALGVQRLRGALVVRRLQRLVVPVVASLGHQDGIDARVADDEDGLESGEVRHRLGDLGLYRRRQAPAPRRDQRVDLLGPPGAGRVGRTGEGGGPWIPNHDRDNWDPPDPVYHTDC
jgi:hypothetical protein